MISRTCHSVNSERDEVETAGEIWTFVRDMLLAPGEIKP